MLTTPIHTHSWLCDKQICHPDSSQMDYTHTHFLLNDIHMWTLRFLRCNTYFFLPDTLCAAWRTSNNPSIACIHSDACRCFVLFMVATINPTNKPTRVFLLSAQDCFSQRRKMQEVDWETPEKNGPPTFICNQEEQSLIMPVCAVTTLSKGTYCFDTDSLLFNSEVCFFSLAALYI